MPLDKLQMSQLMTRLLQFVNTLVNLYDLVDLVYDFIVLLSVICNALWILL